VDQNPIRIIAGKHSYEVHVGEDILEQLGQALTGRFSSPRCAIISDQRVASRFGERARKSLNASGFEPVLIVVPSGEKSKSLEQVGAVCEQMIAAGLDRQSFVIGFGGGVIGDISGFVAAVYHRGIPHIQVPTTLLAMVDSSIGGKTGVNTDAGKNLIGAVHHPALVIDDVDLLKTLPFRELKQGIAEIIKHAIIADREMFGLLKTLPASVFQLNDNASNSSDLKQLIRRNIEIKSRVVAADELDRNGERALLNFGHTVGHAIEQAGGYREFLHGEAISLGMVAAGSVSMKKAGLPAEQCQAIADLLQHYDLPIRLPPQFSREKIFQALPLDKKFEGGKIRFVVTPAIGSARLASDITMDDIRQAVNSL
jgi:3-dehydroquinate synthase